MITLNLNKNLLQLLNQVDLIKGLRLGYNVKNSNNNNIVMTKKIWIKSSKIRDNKNQ
jgi:hypothetical protein